MLQLGSSDDPHISHDFDLMVINLQTLADAAAKQRPPISMYVYNNSLSLRKAVLSTLMALRAYEMWAWGTYV